jgi:LmbE family N-acetylglucosaminyl deacetylase
MAVDGAFLRTLFVGAHLDDIELAAGGTAARLCALGAQVRWLVLSDSGYASFDGRTHRRSDVALAEGRAAAKVLGVEALTVRDFPAKDIENDSRAVEAIEAVIEEFDPTTVFTHWPFDTHRSHANTALATIAAARRRNSILMYEPITPSGRSYVGFKPQAYVAIDGVVELKEAALRCHASEYGKYGEAWIEGMLARARYRGFEMAARFGEAFEVLRLELGLQHGGSGPERRGQAGEVGDHDVGVGEPLAGGRPPADPGGAQAGAARARDVEPEVVADVHDVGRWQPEA